VLRAKGILPQRETVEVTEEDVVNIVESTIAEKSKGELSFSFLQCFQPDTG